MTELLEFVHNFIVHPLLGITRVLYVAAQRLHDVTIPAASDEPEIR